MDSKFKVVIELEFDPKRAKEEWNFSFNPKIEKDDPDVIAERYVEYINQNTLKPFTFLGVDLRVNRIRLVKSGTQLISVPLETIF